MAANIAQNAAVFFSLEEPGRSRGRTQPVRPNPDNLNHFANRAVSDQIAGIDRAFDMQPFRIIHGVLAASCFGFFACSLQLLQGREAALCR